MSKRLIKLEDSYSPILRFTVKPQHSRWCGISEEIDTQIDGTKQSPEIDPHKYHQSFGGREF